MAVPLVLVLVRPLAQVPAPVQVLAPEQARTLVQVLDPLLGQVLAPVQGQVQDPVQAQGQGQVQARGRAQVQDAVRATVKVRERARARVPGPAMVKAVDTVRAMAVAMASENITSYVRYYDVHQYLGV